MGCTNSKVLVARAARAEEQAKRLEEEIQKPRTAADDAVEDAAEDAPAVAAKVVASMEPVQVNVVP